MTLRNSRWRKLILSAIGMTLVAGPAWSAVQSVSTAHLGAFSIDPNPVVLSIARTGSSPTNAATVQFTVTFSESVTGVDTNDFVTFVSGLTGTSVTNVSGSGSVYTVTASTGTGNGTLRLDVATSATINDTGANPFGNGGYTGGEIYTIDKTEPTTPIMTFPLADATYLSATWAAGCNPVGLCGSALDADSGLANVKVSIRQGTTSGNYWNGTNFASATEVLNTATGTTTWNYAFPFSNFPATGAYRVRVQSTDNATNTSTFLERDILIDIGT